MLSFVQECNFTDVVSSTLAATNQPLLLNLWCIYMHITFDLDIA